MSLPQVLFVCVENSCRSQMAEAFARIYGSGVIHAHSAGSHPSGRVNAKAIESMLERGYDLTRHASKPLSQIADIDYEYAITMGCGDACPFVRARHREDWSIPDPKELPPEEFRRIRDLIETKVKELLAKLGSVRGGLPD